ncbi:MAG: hypothetical protein JSS27_17310 [Planctomycetes bacterium]|nr:hypothetical protein [Planctomycetota bacterium]
MSRSDPATMHGPVWLVGVDPRVKLVWLLALSTLSVSVDSMVALIALAVVESLPLAGVRLSWRGWGAVLLLLLGGAWAAVSSQAVFYRFEPRTPLFSVMGVTIWREGAFYGAVQSLRFLGTTALGLAIALSTPAARLMAGMSWFRVPTSVSFMTITALRFLPVLAEQWRQTRQALWLRGYRPGRELARLRLGAALRVEIGVLLPLLASLLRRSTTLATAVTARGFDPAGRRTEYPVLRATAVECVATGLLLLVTVTVVGFKLFLWQAALWEWQPELLEPWREYSARWL